MNAIQKLKRVWGWIGGHRRTMAIFAACFALFLVLPFTAHAWLSIGDFAYIIVAKVMFVLSWMVSQIGAIVVTFQAWLIGILLDLSTQVVSSPVVFYGYPVVLAIANLAFLIGIIVIAIATILRYDSYGVKQALWRLAVMAILINFGLVISSAVLQVSDTTAKYFLNAVNPSANGGQFMAFGSAIAGAFNPQKGVLGVNVSDPDSGVVSMDSIGALLAPITSIIFVILSLLGIIITLGALIIMLILRYAKLTFLLVTLPLQWAAWVFPDTRKYFSKWWEEFIRQAFFTPIVLFFLWLVIITGSEMSKGPQKFLNLSNYTGGGADTPYGALSTFFTGLFSAPMEQLLQTSVMISLLLGGLSAANHLNIQFAGQAQKAAVGAMNSVKGYAKRRGAQAGTGVFNRIGGDKFASSLQTGSAPPDAGRLARFGATLGRVPGVRIGASYVGAGLQQVGKTGAKEAASKISSMNEQDLAKSFNRLTPYEKVAAMEKLHASGKLNLVDPKLLNEYASPDQEKLFNSYGKGKLLKDIRDETGLEFRSLVEQVRTASNKDRARKQLSEYLGSSNNIAKYTETLFGSNQNTIGLDGKNSSEDALEIQNMKEALIAATITEGVLGAGQVNAVLQQVARKDVEQEFKQAAQKTINAQGRDFKVNSALYKSIESGAGKSLGITAEKLGIPTSPLKEEKDAPKITITDSGPSNVRSTTKFDDKGNPVT